MKTDTMILKRWPGRSFALYALAALMGLAAFSLLTPAMYADDPTVMICFRGRTLQIPQSQTSRYPGYTPGACPVSPSL